MEIQGSTASLGIPHIFLPSRYHTVLALAVLFIIYITPTVLFLGIMIPRRVCLEINPSNLVLWVPPTPQCQMMSYFLRGIYILTWSICGLVEVYRCHNPTWIEVCILIFISVLVNLWPKGNVLPMYTNLYVGKKVLGDLSIFILWDWAEQSPKK